MISVIKLDIDPDKSKIVLNNVELSKEMEEEYQKTIEFVEKMNAKGIKLDDIVEISNLTEKEVREMLKKQD